MPMITSDELRLWWWLRTCLVALDAVLSYWHIVELPIGWLLFEDEPYTPHPPPALLPQRLVFATRSPLMLLGSSQILELGPRFFPGTHGGILKLTVRGHNITMKGTGHLASAGSHRGWVAAKDTSNLSHMEHESCAQAHIPLAVWPIFSLSPPPILT